MEGEPDNEMEFVKMKYYPKTRKGELSVYGGENILEIAVHVILKAFEETQGGKK